jgi:hypothetical protein
MKNPLIPLFVLIPFALVFNGCKKENMCDCIKGTGDIEKEKRAVADFTSIEVNDNIYVTLTQDTVNSLEVEAGKNILPLIKATVDGGMLKVENDNKCNWVRSYKKEIHMYVHVKDLRNITSYSTQNITSTNAISSESIEILNYFNGDISVTIDAEKSFTKQMGAGGDITVSGHSGFNYVFSQGYGPVRLENLDSDSAMVWQKGTSDIYISVRNTLDVQIDYIGSVYYAGNPVIEQRPSAGSGRLIHE